jgi:hypothetical protein
VKNFATFFFTLLFYGSVAQAAVTINFVESGGDVVATSSGSLITTGLPNPSQLFTTLGYVAGTGFDASWSCVVLVGTDPSQADTFSLTNWTNDNTDVCDTGGRFVASSGTGNFVGLGSRNGSTDVIYIPDNYVSGSPIAGTSTWSGATFASLGLVPGTYEFTFGSGETADSITLNIGAVIGPPPVAYTVSGTVSGLTGSVTLQNNGADDILKTTNDGFSFPPQADGSSYAVTVSAQPAGQTCNVTNGSGTIMSADVTNVAVTCADIVLPPPPAPPAPAVPVPTMSQWALITLAVLLGLAIFYSRRRFFR